MLNSNLQFIQDAYGGGHGRAIALVDAGADHRGIDVDRPVAWRFERCHDERPVAGHDFEALGGNARRSAHLVAMSRADLLQDADVLPHFFFVYPEPPRELLVRRRIRIRPVFFPVLVSEGEDSALDEFIAIHTEPSRKLPF